MTPEEVIGNFVSFEFMIKGSRKINELDGPSTSEAQPVAFKATEEKKEESTPSRTPIGIAYMFSFLYSSEDGVLNGLLALLQMGKVDVYKRQRLQQMR